MNRNAKKCEKEEKAEKLKLKKVSSQLMVVFFPKADVSLTMWQLVVFSMVS